MKNGWKYAVCGALAGIANGFFGSGGGLVLVPLFCRWCGLETHKAYATSVSVVLPLSTASALIYLMRWKTDFVAALPFLVGGLLGGFLGGKYFSKVPAIWLKRIFALFLLYGGVRSLFF